MNKKTLIIFLVVVVIIILIIFGIKGCNPRKKQIDTSTQPTTDTTQELPENTELDITKFRDPFINANTDFTCETLKNPDIAKDDKLRTSKLDDAYKKYGFPIDDNETMIQILNKYQNDSEVTNVIRGNVQKCKTENTATETPPATTSTESDSSIQ
ncbi:MAG: hypothetical protein WC269_00830 [Candidatus Gracilibacteria bacterium]|jgi:hypothetical protein